jgi:hypothetical protein
MDNSFAITIAFIILATFVAAFVRRVTRDKCLRDFRGYFVNLLRTDGSTVSGTLRVENTGLEFIYRTKRKDASGYDEASYIFYKGEYPKVQLIIRYLDELLDRAARQRQKRLVKTYHPKLPARMRRKTANLFRTVRDSISEVVGLLISRAKKTAVVGATLTAQDRYVAQMQQQVLGAASTSYEPLLERYIGRKVVVEMIKGDTVVEYSGVLREYTADFIEIMDVDYAAEKTQTPRKADIVVPRQYALVRHLGE